MRRTALTTATLAALALPGAAHAVTPTDVPPSAVPELSARLDACAVGATSAQRAAAFTGAMPADQAAAVLSMRFELEQRRGSTWKPLAVPGFRTWQRSDPDAAGFVYAKRVERLASGASYRVTVGFRWTDADGRVVRRAERRTRVCRQPDLRPDLTVLGVTAEPSADGTVRYVAQVRNDGPGALTGPLRVALAVDGTAAPAQEVARLAARATTQLTWSAPPCVAGGAVRVDADPDAAVEEADEADNAFVLRCT